MGNIERSDDDEYVFPPPEPVHPDDAIVHGARWRRERDEARQQLRGAVEASAAVVEAWDAYLRDDDDDPAAATWCALRDAINALRLGGQ